MPGGRYGDPWQESLGVTNSSYTYDGIGNPLSDGTWTYNWEHGRELASMTKGCTAWTYTYDVNGMRTKRTNGTTTYTYVYNGSRLTQMTAGSTTLYFTYDAQGHPATVTMDGTVYYYITNLQGDVIAIWNETSGYVADYSYNAWGRSVYNYKNPNHTLDDLNPLRYRGYVWDSETGLYYLQSRYYNPEWGRFINSDVFASTGQSFTGNNMFAYCGNNPVVRVDSGGNFWDLVGDIISLALSVAEVIEDPTDVGAWVGLVCDAADVALPLVSGLGETARVVNAAVEVADVVDDVHDTQKAAEAVKTGWNVGDDITNLTKAGNDPSWSAVRKRYWKNEAYYNPSKYTDDNLALMKTGRAPLVELDGQMYSMELHHIVARRNGGSNAYHNLLQVAPWEHAEIDSFRYFAR